MSNTVWWWHCGSAPGARRCCNIAYYHTTSANGRSFEEVGRGRQFCSLSGIGHFFEGVVTRLYSQSLPMSNVCSVFFFCYKETHLLLTCKPTGPTVVIVKILSLNKYSAYSHSGNYSEKKVNLIYGSWKNDSHCPLGQQWQWHLRWGIS